MSSKAGQGGNTCAGFTMLGHVPLSQHQLPRKVQLVALLDLSEWLFHGVH